MKRRLLEQVGVAVAAVVWALACDYPVAQKPAGFPHSKHLTELRCGGPNLPACLSCNSCHSGVRNPKESISPGVAKCQSCHQDAAQVYERSVQATDPDQPLGRAIRFSHREHLDLRTIRGQCVKCHAGVVSKKPGATTYPSMSSCLSCHQEEFDKGRCTPCHDPKHLKQLVPLTFSRHDAGWIRRHGQTAKRIPNQCNQCHAEAQCAECHDNNQRIPVEARRPERIDSNFLHRADFVTRHAIEARSQPATCLKCHSTASCDACHVRNGVSGNSVGGVNPHPIGWLGPDTESRNYHGRAARRNIVTCAVCHERGPATNCIRCHSVGGNGGNPHPSGWSSSRPKDAAMCRYCHEP